MTEYPSKTDVFRSLTWNDIQEWAGIPVVSRGRNYQRHHRVQGLAFTPAGGMIAWVQGTERYATVVDIEDGKLISACTCPYGSACKHAVAMVLEYLDHVKHDTAIPIATERDERLALLRGVVNPNTGSDREKTEQGCFAPNVLHSYLDQQSQEHLIALLKDLANRYPVVRQALQDRYNLSMGSAADLVSTVRKEIESLSTKPGWRNSWSDEGYTPDYSQVRNHLEVLLANGYADEVVALGKRVIETGIKLVEISQDEGETVEEISSCMPVVFQALLQSSLSSADQMLWAIEAELADEYDLCQGAEEFWEREHAVADWNAVAERLRERLNDMKWKKGDDSFLRSYHRERLTDWLINALENADREGEIIPLCESEAEKTGSYVRLAKRLLEANRRAEAERWIREGVVATQEEWPGVASQLRTMLKEMRERENDWLGAAALRAEDFFTRPSLETFQELQKMAEQAGIWPSIRMGVMHYLETGDIPKITGKQTTPSWPLPETGLAEMSGHQQMYFPMVRTLIDIAIAENRPDEVTRWYDYAEKGSIGLGWTWFQQDKIAEAIADTYPDRALAIWKKLSNGMIAHTQPKAYETAAGFLHGIRRTLRKLGRENEWRTYLAELRQAHARKKRLMEILEHLEGGPIVKRGS